MADECTHLDEAEDVSRSSEGGVDQIGVAADGPSFAHP